MLQNHLINAILQSLYWKNRTAWIRRMSSRVWQPRWSPPLNFPSKIRRFLPLAPPLSVSAWLYIFTNVCPSYSLTPGLQLESQNLLGLPGKGYMELTCSRWRPFAGPPIQAGFQSFPCNYGRERSSPARGDTHLWPCRTGLYLELLLKLKHIRDHLAVYLITDSDSEILGLGLGLRFSIFLKQDSR